MVGGGLRSLWWFTVVMVGVVGLCLRWVEVDYGYGYGRLWLVMVDCGSRWLLYVLVGFGYGGLWWAIATVDYGSSWLLWVVVLVVGGGSRWLWEVLEGYGYGGLKWVMVGCAWLWIWSDEFLQTSNSSPADVCRYGPLTAHLLPHQKQTTPKVRHAHSSHKSFRGGFKNWHKGDFIGSGAFGFVYEGFSDRGEFFAVKEVSLLDSGSQNIIQLQQEIALLSQLRHENIVRYLGTDTDNDKLCIFLELVTKGSLAKLYQKYKLRDSQVSTYTRQILSGLNYLHEQNVVHRDIKCANILVDASGSVKLADFGLAKATTLSGIKSCKGSPYWMAPEVIHSSSNKGYGLAADIWSLGCTVLEMLTRKNPYFPLEGVAAMFRIATGKLPSIPDTLSTEARDFILKCLQFNPNDRPTAAQLLDHPFIMRRSF